MGHDILLAVVVGPLSVAKDFRHAPVAGKALSARAYEEPSWHYESQKTFPAIGACPKSVALSSHLCCGAPAIW